MLRILGRRSWHSLSFNQIWQTQSSRTCSHFGNYNPLEKYLVSHERYKVFRKEPQTLYQFDDNGMYTAKWTQHESCVDWQDAQHTHSHDDLISAFNGAINYSIDNEILLSDERFDQFIDLFISKLPHFNTNELLASLQLFAKCPLTKQLIKQRNYIELHMAFDQESTIHCFELNIDQILFMCSLWFQLPNIEKTYLVRCACNRIQRQFSSMTVTQVIHSLYVLNCLMEKIDRMDTIEKVFTDNVHDLTMEEMSIVAWTFSKQEQPIRQKELKTACLDHLETLNLGQLEGVFVGKLLPVSSFCCISDNYKYV